VTVRRAAIITVVTLVVLAVMTSSVWMRQECTWVDAVSGSTRRQTLWRPGFASEPVVTVSPLETRFGELGLVWTHDWRQVRGNYQTLWGGNTGSAHGPAPLIYDLAASPNLQEALIASSSDEELRELFRVLTEGTRDKQEIVIAAACRKALAVSASQPTRESQ
jgi:hypothetical protein